MWHTWPEKKIASFQKTKKSEQALLTRYRKGGITLEQKGKTRETLRKEQ